MTEDINIKTIQRNSKDIIRRIQDLTAMLKDIEDAKPVSGDAEELQFQIEAVRCRFEDCIETLQAHLNGLNVLAEFFFRSDEVLSEQKQKQGA